MKTFKLIMPQGPFLKKAAITLIPFITWDKTLFQCTWSSYRSQGGKETLTWIFMTGIIKESNLIGKIKAGGRDLPFQKVQLHPELRPTQNYSVGPLTSSFRKTWTSQHRLISEARSHSLMFHLPVWFELRRFNYSTERDRTALRYIHCHGWSRYPVGICYMIQGVQRGHMYAYGWFLLTYGRNQYNTVKQLSSNLNKWKKPDLYMGPQPCVR